MPTKKSAGKTWEDRMRKRFEQHKCHVQKLPDAPNAFIGRPDLEGFSSRFSPKNPYDFIVAKPVAEGLFRIYALEMKSTAGARFDLSSVKEHQQNGLDRFPSVAGVVVELRALRRAFFVPVGLIKVWEANHGKKSMNHHDLDHHAVELPCDTAGREKRDYYDPRPLLSIKKREDSQCLQPVQLTLTHSPRLTRKRSSTKARSKH